MIRQGFDIGERDWRVEAWYDVTREELPRALARLCAFGADEDTLREAGKVLGDANTGCTFTDYDGRRTLMLIGHATSRGQQFDTIVHEMKHLVEHISSYFGVDPKEELAAYLQGEVGRKMWVATAMVSCR